MGMVDEMSISNAINGRIIYFEDTLLNTLFYRYNRKFL